MKQGTFRYNHALKRMLGIIRALHTSIRALYDIKNNRHLRKFSSDVLDPLCVKALRMSSYAYFGLGLMTVSTIFIVIISIRLHKLRKTGSLKAAVRFVGLMKRLTAKRDP